MFYEYKSAIVTPNSTIIGRRIVRVRKEAADHDRGEERRGTEQASSRPLSGEKNGGEEGSACENHFPRYNDTGTQSASARASVERTVRTVTALAAWRGAAPGALAAF